MSHTITTPTWLRSKSGEEISDKMLSWIIENQRKLRKAFPLGERAFCRILDKLRSRLPKRWDKRLCYNRQKYFVVTSEIVFFGDFFFRNLHMLIEIDGASHLGTKAMEKDEWRTRLICSKKLNVFRTTNASVLEQDFREVESWFVGCVCSILPKSLKKKFADDYEMMKEQNPHIYKEERCMTTYKIK